MDAIIKSYDTHLDAKKRITLRGAKFQNYFVKVFDNGCIILEPRVLKMPDAISKKTIDDLDRAVANIKAGTVSDPVDLSDF